MKKYDLKKIYIFINHIILLSGLCINNMGLKDLSITACWYINLLLLGIYSFWLYFVITVNEERKVQITKINILIGIFIFILFCVYKINIFNEIIKDRGIENVLESYGKLGKVIYFTICFLQPIVLPLPEPITITAGNVVFGKAIGFALGLSGTILGISTMFIVSRMANNFLDLNVINSKNITKYNELVKRNETVILTLLFIFPILPDEVICMGAGLSLIKFKKFLVIAFLSKLLTIGIYSASSGIVKKVLELNLIYQLLIVIGISIFIVLIRKTVKFIKTKFQ